MFPHRYWIENEHCQYLNVWTQNLTPAVKKPVMVWMHGGGFTNGSSMESYAYDGRSLSEFGDVVVVSVNHRLNILGTLDLSAYGPQYANSRYTGTADLVAALQWVRDNIESFGGDPGNVMIFGQSGGGGKVVRMLHTPDAKGLFHKVAAQSGGNNTYRTTDPAASIKAQQTIAAHTLKNLNLTGDQIDKLKTVPYSALIAAGTAALRSAAQELGRPALNWEVIADDQYVMREFCDWADTIPLMAGAVFSEMQGTLTRGDGRKNEWSQKEIDDQLTAAFADKKNDIVAEFKQAFPRKKVQDVLYYAGASRPGVKNLLARKLEKKQGAGLQLPVRVGIPDQWRHHVLPLLRARVLLPRPERAADPDGDGRRSGRHGAAGQGLAGVDQLRPHAAIPPSPGSNGSPIRRTTRRRWCSTPSASRSRSATTSWCRCCRQLPVAVERLPPAAAGRGRRVAASGTIVKNSTGQRGTQSPRRSQSMDFIRILCVLCELCVHRELASGSEPSETVRSRPRVCVWSSVTVLSPDSDINRELTSALAAAFRSASSTTNRNVVVTEVEVTRGLAPVASAHVACSPRSLRAPA